MKPAPFDYLRPDSLEEGLAVLARHGHEAAVLAGGQSLMPLMAHRKAAPGVVVDINRLGQAFDALTANGDGLRIGALVRHARIERLSGDTGTKRLLARAVRHIGNTAVRNRGTVCGSLALADPAAEWSLIAVALNGRIRLASQRGERWVDAGDFLRAPFSTAREPDELVCELALGAATGPVHFDEIAPRFAAPALASLALVETECATRIVVGAATGTPTVLVKTARLAADGAPVEEIVEIMRAELRDRIIVADPQYRLHLLETLLTRALGRMGKAVSHDRH